MIAVGVAVALTTARPGYAATWAEQCAREWPLGLPTSCQKAVEENARDIQSRRNLARAFIVIGDDRRALRTHEDITRFAPDDPMSHFHYGTTAGTLRYYGVAVEALRQAIRLKPDFVEAYLVLSIALEKLGQVPEALSAKLKAAELGDMTAMYEVAEAYAAGLVGAPDERKALKWMERAAMLGHIEAMDRMVEIYREGRWGEERNPRKAAEWSQRARDARN